MGFLDVVVAQKQRELATKKRNQPLTLLLREKTDTGPVRDFRRAITARDGETKIIAELKARTPSIESFVQSDHLDDLAETYEQNGAAAISVVTDAANFGTSLETVRRARERTGLPVLVKDFIIDPYQVHEARTAGADAVLLIARLLEAPQLEELLELAGTLGMEVLVETRSAGEIQKAQSAGASIIGINNRDLDTLEVSLDTTRRLVREIPAGTTIVTESGINTRADIESLAEAGANIFLIGGKLLSATNPGAMLREMRGTPA
jgi:indole-3-glycerol phosphate synthase